MPTYTYDTTVPAANDAPKNDQPIMQTNTASISGLISQDHVGFNTPNGGYHTIIHQGPQGANPGAIVGIGQTYTKTISGDQQLFYESGAGIITQLTGPNTPLAANNGYMWLPGGILMQWGRKSFSGSGNQNVTINYVLEGNIAMPNATFVAFATLHPTGSSVSSTAQISTTNRSSSQFIVHYTGSGDYDEFQWLAIGN